MIILVCSDRTTEHSRLNVLVTWDYRFCVYFIHQRFCINLEIYVLYAFTWQNYVLCFVRCEGVPFYFKPLHCFKLYRDNGSFPCSWHMSDVCAWCVKCLLNPSLWLLKVILMECFSILHPFYHAEVEKRYSSFLPLRKLTYQNSLGPLCSK